MRKIEGNTITIKELADRLAYLNEFGQGYGESYLIYYVNKFFDKKHFNFQFDYDNEGDVFTLFYPTTKDPLFRLLEKEGLAYRYDKIYGAYTFEKELDNWYKKALYEEARDILKNADDEFIIEIM